MHPIRTTIAASALVLAGLALSTPAHALSCMWGIHGASVQEGDVVPLNTRIMVEHTFDAQTDIDIVLEDEPGTPVDIQIDRYHQFAILTLDSDLAAGSYRLHTPDENTGWIDTTFTVGTDLDDEAPEAPAFRTLDRQFDASEWGDTKGIHAEASEVDGAAWYEFEISESRDFADAARVASLFPNVFLGQGLCDDSVPEYRHRNRYHVRVRAVDAAGNASEWTRSNGEVRGCSTVGPAPLLFGLPIGLLAMATRRRD